MGSPRQAKGFYVLVVLLLVALVVDYLVGNIADIISEFVKSNAGIGLFLVVSLASIAGQLYLLSKVKTVANIQGIRKSSSLNYVQVIQYILIAIIIIIIAQVITGSYYSTPLLSISTTISYGLTIIIMGILAWKLLVWFRSSKNLALLLYGLAAAVIIFNAIFTIILFDSILMEKPQTITRESEIIFNLGFEPGTSMSLVVTSQSTSYSAYFLLTWGGTIMILRHNIQRIGRIKFWALVSFPIVFFMSNYFALYQELYPESAVTQALSVNFAIPILIYSGIVTICGILFGVGFLLIAKSVSSASRVKEYMRITGFGFILFFTASSATVLQAAYPPFGLANVSMVGLCAYLIYFGLYFSAVSVANDVQLRHVIRKTLLDKSKLLDSLGDAQMKQELEKSVFDVVKNNADRLERESGAPPVMTEQEIHQYSDVVIREIRR
jgi:hypothetical protein